MKFADLVDFFRQMGAQIKETWGQLSLNARVMLVGVGLMVAMPILYVAFFLGGEARYITLADNLSAQQISETIAILDEQGVPHQLDPTARTVRVLPKDRSRMLLLLEQNELPVGRSIPTGFDKLFENPDFMSNQWYNDVNYMRAVQGELEQQLSSLDFIDYAKVLIREADNEYFIEEQIPSNASVVIGAKRPISDIETKLIVSMVSRAGGPNLHAGNITVATTDGGALHLPSDSGFASMANDKLEYQDRVENRIEKKITEKLKEIGVLGSVTVGAEINFDQQEITANSVTEGLPISELSIEQEITSVERLPEGAPGALQNVPEAAAAPGGTRTEDTMSEELTNYELGRTTTLTKTDPGNVVRYKVGLVVKGDDYETVTTDDGSEEQQYVGLTEKTRLACLAMAQSAVAAEDAGAESIVTIVDHSFEFAGMPGARELVEQQGRLALREGRQQWINVGILIAGLLLTLFLLRRALKNSIIYPSDEKVEERVKDIPEATLEDMRRQEVAAEISQLSLDDPEAVAALLRSWMSEDEE